MEQHARQVRAIRPMDGNIIYSQTVSSQMPPPSWGVVPGRYLFVAQGLPTVAPPWRVEERGGFDTAWVTVTDSDYFPDNAVCLIWPQ